MPQHPDPLHRDRVHWQSGSVKEYPGVELGCGQSRFSELVNITFSVCNRPQLDVTLKGWLKLNLIIHPIESLCSKTVGCVKCKYKQNAMICITLKHKC